jgi:hypothetical protein
VSHTLGQGQTLGQTLSRLPDVIIDVDARALADAVKAVRELEERLDDLGKSFGEVKRTFSDEELRRGVGGIPEFARGGRVPGPVGAPTLAVVHGGETVLPPGVAAAALSGSQPFGMGEGTTIVNHNETFSFPNYLGDKHELVDLLRTELIRVARRNPDSLGGTA